MELAILLISPTLLEVQLLLENINLQPTDSYNLREKRPKTSVATTPDTATLEYYQSIYTHCKQRFNIPDGIEVVKKSVYQYIKNRLNNYFFGNYNISEVRSNFYNNLVHYSQLGTENLNIQSKYSIDFESETETSNKDKHKLKQYSKTTLNTPILPKTTAKHLQTPEQRTSSKLPLIITPFPTRKFYITQNSNLFDFLAENQSEHSETAANEENDSEITEEESIDSENKEDKMTAYIAKIPEFNGKDIETSSQEWLDQDAFKAVFLEQFTDNNTSIILRNWFRNIKQKSSKSVMTYIGKFNKLLRRIRQLKTNDYYSDAQILDQFIAGLKDKLIKKVHPHAPEDLNSAIQHMKRYEMAMEETNHTKLQPQKYQPPQRQNQNNFAPLSNNQSQNCHYCGISDHWKKIAESYIPEEQDFHHIASSEGRTTAQQQNSSHNHTTILPARIAENANLSDIFFFEFEANESPFLLSNAVANNQKAITAMYTEAEAEGKPIRLILDSGSAGSIITYQLIWNIPYSKPEPKKQCPYIPLKCKDCHKKLLSMGACILSEEEYENHTCYYYMLPEECNWIDVAIRRGVCDQTCQYALSISEKVKGETPFDAAYNSAFNKLYHYPHDAKMIFDLAMALINGATQENVRQMKESEYIVYIFEIARYNYEDEVEVYHQIDSHTYPTKEV
ncbi:hypothetical protein G9A89_017657 [Geosiphon pyriformis]|nr:hypothetical protein G9A89_017657 [Geosiphon pyriformis]